MDNLTKMPLAIPGKHFRHKKTRYCEICGEKFKGASYSKYCKFHHDYRNRYIPGKTRKKTDPSINNKIIIHGLTDAVTVELNCSICGMPYRVNLASSTVYPKYCEEHRSEYKRTHYMKELQYAY